MKRDDMVDKLHKSIKEWTSISRYGKLVIDASEILAEIEEAGMLPPPILVSVEDLDGKHQRVITANKWE